MIGRTAFSAAMLLLSVAAGDTLAQPCVGDCDGDGVVGVNELVIGVGFALGRTPLPAGPAFAVDNTGQGAGRELTRAGATATDGCRTAARITGACARPGPGPRGLVACDAGTPVRAYRCADRATCLSARPLPTAGSTAVEANGQWQMLVDPSDASATLVFEADIEGIIVFRTIDIGSPAGVGLVAGESPARDVRIDPTTEASVRLLDLNGLERFTDEEVVAVQDAVDAATAMVDFSVLATSGYSPVDAADLVTLAAVRDPAVIDAVQDGIIDPGVLPTRTPTPTLTQVPTATATPPRRLAFVANLGSDTVSVIDANLGAVVDTVGVGESPEGVAATPDGRWVLVVNSGPPAPGAPDIETVSIIDAATHQVVSTVPDFNPNEITHPFVVAVSPDGQLAYVTHNASATVEVLDLNRALDQPATARVGVIPVGPAPLGIALARSLPIAFVASVESQTLSVVNTEARQPIGDVPLPAKPAFVVLTSDDSLAYVTNQLVRLPGQMEDEAGSTVSIVDTRRAIENPADAVIGSLAVGLQPTGLALDADDRLLLVVNAGSDSLSVFDRGAMSQTTVPLLGGSVPQAVALARDGGHAYVTNCALDSVSVVDVERSFADPLNAVVSTIPVGVCPQGIAIVESP
jgi:YVTN family beta-propeller protein